MKSLRRLSALPGMIAILCFEPCFSFAQREKLVEEGVSWELAEHRKASIKDLTYDLHFTIPQERTTAIEGVNRVSFSLSRKEEIIFDFRESEDKIHRVLVNGKASDYVFENDHIIINKERTRKGKNIIEIAFTAGSQGLNRREGYVYTLFVPDRARTVFPCFDQPNLKAKFKLDLDIPETWEAVTNGIDGVIDTPIPTYLFAFAAGEFKHEQYSEDGYTIGAYHRETDSLRIAQLPDIMHQVVFSLKWQEKYTGVEYPFPKYDLVILPGFQFGGMEHVGATFYNDNTIFLPANPTPDELLRRTELIAHETSHMWFGDAVTMNWFDDVWTKEVFANYFAAEITAPLFPELNHSLNWLKTYVNAAISQDRTEGRTSIRQPLPNLRYAGLIYNNIIYNKAPVMMRKMVELMGEESFQRGIRKYVERYKYGNATWDDLVLILDAETTADLRSFSKQWVDEAHWPSYTVTTIHSPRISKEYGYCDLTSEQCDTLLHHFDWNEETDGTHKQSLLMALNENYLNRKFDDREWMEFLISKLSEESDPLTSLTLTGYMNEPMLHTLSGGYEYDTVLLQLSENHPLNAVRTQLLRLLSSKAQTPSVVESLYNIWNENNNSLLAQNDYMTLAYELAVRMPDKAEEILNEQRSRIENPDRLAQFNFIARAVSPLENERDSLFASLAIAENRRIEPWTLSVLYYLNHPLRQQSAIKYIRPALELLPEIQHTGDIFFPGNWCNSLLAGHRSKDAYQEVERFLADHQDLLPLLRNKILSAEYYLERIDN